MELCVASALRRRISRKDMTRKDMMRTEVAARLAMQRDLRGLAELAWRKGKSESEWAFPPIVIKPAGGNRGLGAFAARDLAAGDLLVAESPLVHWKTPRASGFDEFEFAFHKLDATRKNHFWEFRQSQGEFGTEPTFKGVWLNNALPIAYDGQPSEQAPSDGDGCGEAGLFATASRFNHACAPSCHYCWDPRRGQMTVRALRAVPRGEELTISYLAPGGRVRAERQRLLQRNFGFVCACPTKCALAGSALTRSDMLQRAIGDLAPDSDASGAPLSTSRFGAAPEALTRMLIEEGLPMIWARSTLWSAMLQSEQPSLWAGRLKEVMALAMGADHPSVETLEKVRKVSDAMGPAAFRAAVAAMG